MTYDEIPPSPLQVTMIGLTYNNLFFFLIAKRDYFYRIN